MNGARSTFMRKGYWLTALAAAVLLAASPGTAFGSRSKLTVKLATTTVDEGAEATATLKFTVTAGDITVTLGVDPDVTVAAFAFVIDDLTTSPKATKADRNNFSDLTTTADAFNSQVVMTVAALAAGRQEVVRRNTPSV